MRALCCLLVIGCGGSGDDVQPDAPQAVDAGVIDAITSDAGFPLTGGEANDPSDFTDRLGCVPGSLGALDPVGTWHVDTTISYGTGTSQWNDAFRIFLASARRSGITTRELLHTDDDLLVRWVYMLGSGTRIIRTYDACALNADGSISGKYADCRSTYVASLGQACFFGTFRAVRMEYIAGEADAQGLVLLSEFNGPPTDPWGTGITTNVRVHNGVAYVSRQIDGLRIVDVSNPGAPRNLARYLGGFGGYNDVKLIEAGGRVYALASGDSTNIHVVDVTDPASPVGVAEFPDWADVGGVHTLATETIGVTTVAYFGNDREGSLEIWDVSDPTTPIRLGGYVHPNVGTYGGYVHDLSVQNGIVYLNYWNLGFVVLDATDPAAPTMVGEFNTYNRRTSHSNWVTTLGGCRVAVHGDEDFDAHLRLIGVDPTCGSTFMQQIGELRLRSEVSIHNILAFGNMAYVAHYQDGVRLFDITNPAAPAMVGWYHTWDQRIGDSFFEGALGIDVDLANRLVYVADHPRGLIILQLL